MDLLTSKGFVRRWTLDDAGWPVCRDDPVPASDARAAEYMAYSQAVLEAHEGAIRLAEAMRVERPENGEPRQIPVLDDDGEPQMEDGHPVLIDNPEWGLAPRKIDGEDNPQWAAHDAAQAVIASCGAMESWLVQWRAGDNELRDLALAELADIARQITPELPVPQEVALWQARAALAAAGLLDAATAAVQSAGGAIAAAWEYGNVIRRDAPSIAALGAALNLSSDQIDDLFRNAAAVSV